MYFVCFYTLEINFTCNFTLFFGKKQRYEEPPGSRWILNEQAIRTGSLKRAGIPITIEKKY